MPRLAPLRYHPVGRVAYATRRLGLAALAGLILAGPLAAATTRPPSEEPGGRGEAMAQRFLADGVSVVTTPLGSSCVASARIDIAASGYLQADGAAVPFDRIRRSPAASIQAIAGPGNEATPSFRVQLKFSPRPGLPVTLLLGPPGNVREIGLTDFLEASTDSLLVEGEAALALTTALEAGEVVRVVAISRDTGHAVTDALPAPNLAGLADCAADLAPGTEPGPLATQVSLRFEAAPGPDSLATPERLRACGMAPTDRPLHVGRLTATTGFFAQTDTVFVAFDEEGRVERAYVPGILDADLSNTDQGVLRVSQAADGNVPDAANAVTGCIGAHEVVACAQPDGTGAFRIAACGSLLGGPGSGLIAGTPDEGSTGDAIQLASLVPPGSSPVSGSRPGRGTSFPAFPSGLGGGSGPGDDPGDGLGSGQPKPGEVTDPGHSDEGDSPNEPGGPDGPGGPDLPSPVPLPGSVVLLLGALASLGLARRGSINATTRLARSCELAPRPASQG